MEEDENVNIEETTNENIEETTTENVENDDALQDTTENEIEEKTSLTDARNKSQASKVIEPPIESQSTLLESEVKSENVEYRDEDEKKENEDFIEENRDEQFGDTGDAKGSTGDNDEMGDEEFEEEYDEYEEPYIPKEIIERYEKDEYDEESGSEDREKEITRKFIRKLMAAISYSSVEEDYGSERLRSAPPERRVFIDRELYLAEYERLTEEQMPLRRQNGYLNKKMTEYLKKRKMDHCLKEAPPAEAEELKEKYERKLNSLFDYETLITKEKELISGELQDMTGQRDELKQSKEEMFEAMQGREREVARNLIDARTGKVLSDKVVEKLISRQSAKLEEISKIRLDYIKQREKVKQLEVALKDLEMIGGNLHLMDYEQLRIENQNYADKIEERDDELNRLRTRCSEAVKTLAHVREKSYRVDSDLMNQAEECMRLEREINEYREILNDLKLQRDKNRSETLKLKAESGLLTYPKLLADMKSSMVEVNELTNELQDMNAEYAKTRKKLFNMRKLISKHGQGDRTPPAVEGNEKTKRTKSVFRPPLMRSKVDITRKKSSI